MHVGIKVDHVRQKGATGMFEYEGDGGGCLLFRTIIY